jgi:hypothetical protein
MVTLFMHQTPRIAGLIIFALVSFHLCAQEDSTSRWSVGIEFNPEFSWYKTSQSNYQRPNSSYALSLGLGLGGVIVAPTVGLHGKYKINDRFSVSTGISYGKRGGRFELRDSTMIYAYGSHLIPVAEIDSNYRNSSPWITECRLTDRKYKSTYAIVPVLLRVKAIQKGNMSLHVVGGVQLQFRSNSTFEDQVYPWNDTANRYDGLFTVFHDIEDEMNDFLVALSIGTEWEINLGEHLVFTNGWHYTRGLTNPVSRFSKYNMDERRTEESFATNGKPVASEQKFHMNSLGPTFGLYYRF